MRIWLRMGSCMAKRTAQPGQYYKENATTHQVSLLPPVELIELYILLLRSLLGVIVKWSMGFSSNHELLEIYSECHFWQMSCIFSCGKECSQPQPVPAIAQQEDGSNLEPQHHVA